jgi:hypothetical protein
MTGHCYGQVRRRAVVDQSVFVAQLVWVTYVFRKPYQFQNIEGGGQTVDFQGPTVPVKDGRIVETGASEANRRCANNRRRQTVKRRGPSVRRPPFFARSPRLLSCSGNERRLPWLNQWSAS